MLATPQLIRGRNSVVECQLPKLDVAGSNPVARFQRNARKCDAGKGFTALASCVFAASYGVGRYSRLLSVQRLPIQFFFFTILLKTLPTVPPRTMCRLSRWQCSVPLEK